MTIHKLMNASPVNPDITMKVIDLFDRKVIYEGRYDESPVSVHMLPIFEYQITGIETQEYNPGRYYITSMIITADIW